MVAKPKLLIVFSRQKSDTSTLYGGFVKRIEKNGGFTFADVSYVALENLIFHIQDTENARIYDPISGIEVGDYSFVYLKSWQALPEEAAALALFLEGKGIPYADHQARHSFISKAANYMALWSQGVSVPETVWGQNSGLRHYIENLEDQQFPVILKAIHGQKGNDNYLAKTRTEALQILDESQVQLLLQGFIPNGGDYRIGVYGNQARWAIYRKSGGKSHLNNVSSGATAEHVPIEAIPEGVRTLAVRAAEACDLAVSGVDVVEHAETGELFVFEANQGSQIVTGAFTESNMQAFSEGIEAMMSRRFKGGISPTKRLQTIGRTLNATVILGTERIVVRAKADTGAYRSAIDALDVELRQDDTGREYVTYSIADLSETGRVVTAQTYEFETATIRSSNGLAEQRFVVPVVLEIGGQEYTTSITLARRKVHKNQALLGRVLLRGNFIVNVELGL